MNNNNKAVLIIVYDIMKSTNAFLIMYCVDERQMRRVFFNIQYTRF